MEKVVKKSKKNKRKINKIITILLLIAILVFFSGLFYLNILPLVTSIIILLVTLFISTILVLFNFSRKKGFRIIGYFFSIVIISVFTFVAVYLYNTIGFLFNVTSGNVAIKTYNVVVLNDSKYKDVKDLKNKDVGINENDESIKKVKEKLNKKVKVKYQEYEDSNETVEDLINEKLDATILEDSELAILEENNYEYFSKLKSIYKIEIKNSIKDLQDAVNINKEPFNVFVSGIDTYGKINAVSRSDVNIVLTVNPKTEKILITWIPRDYYVNINNNSMKDKLTHAGIYGVNSSIYALEHLLDIDINYYVKVNFTSVIKIVDALNGITVYNDQTFTTNEKYTFRKGTVNLNGEKALSFVRDRHHVSGGDIGRGKNQIKVLEAIINKARSKEIITSYNKLLNSLSGAFVTNISQNSMIAFIKKEISNPRNWQIESYTLDGKGAYDYTYSYRKNKLYVMIPDKEMVETAKEKINSVLE